MALYLKGLGGLGFAVYKASSSTPVVPTYSLDFSQATNSMYLVLFEDI